MVLIPLFDKVLVEPEEIKETGIVITDEKSPNELIRGRVISTGSGDPRTQTEYEITVPDNGSFIYFHISDAKPLTINGKLHYMLSWWDIYAQEEN